jgi:hypothetical protein
MLAPIDQKGGTSLHDSVKSEDGLPSGPPVIASANRIASPNLVQVPGYGEGKIAAANKSLQQETPELDPLEAFVALLILLELGIGLFLLAWYLPPVLFVIVALAYFIPEPAKVGGGCLPELFYRPFQPVRLVVDRVLAILDPEHHRRASVTRTEYTLELQSGTLPHFTVKGSLLPREPRKGESVRVWTVYRSGRDYFRRGVLIDEDTGEAIPLHSSPAYMGRYLLLVFLFLNGLAAAALVWLRF